MPERIAKFLARSGVCSRREAEELIRQGRITVNGETVAAPVFLVDGTENIRFDGEKSNPRTKPASGCITNPPGSLPRTKTKKGATPFCAPSRRPAARHLRRKARPQFRRAAPADQRRRAFPRAGTPFQRLEPPLQSQSPWLLERTPPEKARKRRHRRRYRLRPLQNHHRQPPQTRRCAGSQWQRRGSACPFRRFPVRFKCRRIAGRTACFCPCCPWRCHCL